MKFYGAVNVESGGEFNTTPETLSISSNTLTVDCSGANIFVVNQNANINTLTISNQADGQHIKILLKQISSGYTITWPGNFYFIGNSALDAVSGQINELDATYISALSLWIAQLETNNSGGVSFPIEYQTATSGQTVFNTSIVSTVADSGNDTFLQVFVNGVYQKQGSSFTVTGANQVTFTYGVSLNSDVIFIQLP